MSHSNFPLKIATGKGVCSLGTFSICRSVVISSLTEEFSSIVGYVNLTKLIHISQTVQTFGCRPETARALHLQPLHGITHVSTIT